jgi:putative FmdB family regulatory protein
MPTYGYRCTSCGHQFETIQKMSDEPLKVCPECQGKLTKVLYPTGVIFKGSGFYTTDYKASGKDHSGNGSGPASASQADSKPETKPEGKSEPKTEPKSESKPASDD